MFYAITTNKLLAYHNEEDRDIFVSNFNACNRGSAKAIPYEKRCLIKTATNSYTAFNDWRGCYTHEIDFMSTPTSALINTPAYRRGQ